MRLGLQIPSFSWPGGPGAIAPQLAEIAAAAETSGFSSLWVMDHFFQLPPQTGWNGPDEPMLEAYATLGYLARATERIRLGAMVSGVIYRHPGVLLKTATTLDVLSGGRSYLGIGASWYEREAKGLGVPYPPRALRFEWLEETLRLAHQVWNDDRTPFLGRHFRLEEPIVNPQPISRPRPPILIGGNGEHRTLRLVARYGDACNILVPDPGESRAKLEVLRRHCEDVGRDIAEIETTSLVELDTRPGRMSDDEIVDRLSEQAEEGIQHVIVNVPNVHELDIFERFEHVIVPATRDLRPTPVSRSVAA